MKDAAPHPRQRELNALAAGTLSNPFELLGPQREAGRRIVRTLQPEAERVSLLNRGGRVVKKLRRVHDAGIFEGELPPRLRSYRLRLHDRAGGATDIDDPYRFRTSFGDIDLYLLGEGMHQRIYTRLGAHVITHQGVRGTCFSVWAPNASRVSVIGDFNNWDGRRHAMRLHCANGVWELFVPGMGPGVRYKFELLDGAGRLLPFKADPVGQFHESPPGNASIVYHSRYRWGDHAWMRDREGGPRLDEPISIYEVHLGSWRRHADGSWLGYRELARQLVEYVTDMGFTHVELLPVTEHPFDGSWGYQPIGLFAPTHRFGEPDDFRYLVDRLHRAGIGVIVDWVPAHFPGDEHGLARFDGTHLYEHEDPRKGRHADWGTLVFNYGRREVTNYLIGSALCWIREFHVDALRVDAVASMLYLDYSRKKGEWVPNVQGGRENLEAVDFLRRLNTVVHADGGATYAEESTAWPGVSRPVESGGLGFTFKWNMGWMNDTLAYMSEEPVHRRQHHDKITFAPLYAFTENFVLALSHDEVVHGKGTLLGRMPGDDWQRFANLRAYLGFMYGHPGKKLLFMGGELGQWAEWNHDHALDWRLLDYPMHRGVQDLVRDLNGLYRERPELHAQDFDGAGFEWIDWNNRDDCVLSWLRLDRDGRFLVCVSNFTPVARDGFRLGIPAPGNYKVLMDTDRVEYGGGGTLGQEEIAARAEGCHGRPHSLEFRLPPLATLVLQPGQGS